MKKTLFFILLSFCPLLLPAQTFFNVDGIRYMIENDHAVIARQDQELTGDFVIPDKVTYNDAEYDVTRLMSPNDSESGGSGAFQGCGITSITLPTSITEIPNNSFEDCQQLRSVVLHGPVTRIGDGSFNNCSTLATINLPDELTVIDQCAFCGCNSLSSVTIPKRVTTIGYIAFSGCSGLSSFNVAEENLYYSSENGVLFNKNKTTLLQYPQSKTETSYIIPNSVTSIEYIAFSGCSNLTSVTIPNSVTSIDAYVFEGCRGLTSISIPNSVTSIGIFAFEDCSSLTQISIGRNVNDIESCVFKGCQSLSEVWCYTTTVPTIASDAFSESNYANATLFVRNTLLEEYNNSEPWKSFSEINEITSLQEYAPYHTIFNAGGIRYMTEDDDAVIARQDRELSGNIIIPSTVTYEGKDYNVTRLMRPDESESGGGGAFQECKITSISLPASITVIPNNTFNSCKLLNSVTLQGPVTRIGGEAFRWCEALTAIDLPDCVTEMGYAAFCESGLTEFKIPAGVTSLDTWLLLDTKITYLEIPAAITSIGILGVATTPTDENGQPLRRTVKMFQRDCRIINQDGGVFGAPNNIDLLVPAGGKVVYQEYYPWINMNSITEYGEDTGEVLVPDQRHVTIDGIRYFLKDGEAKVDIQPATLSGEVTIPEEVTFEDVDYPVIAIMGSNMGTPGWSAHEPNDPFGGAFSKTQVTKVTLPSSITTIGYCAFIQAQKLEEVVLNEGITEIAQSAFAECPELTTINIPSTVTSLLGGTFKDCPKLKTLTLHEGITEMREEALFNSGIETLAIPSTCKSFGSCSLYLPNLKTLIMKVKEPTDIINEGYYHFETMNCSVFADYYLPNYEVVRAFLSNVDVIVPLGCADSYKALKPWVYCHSITEEGEDYYQPKKIGVNIDGINYVLEENTVEGQDEPVRTATIACQNINLSGDIVIPEKVSYAKKVLQGDEWVTLEAYDYEVTDIFSSILEFNGDDRGYSSGEGAFQDCAITSISLPATITTIPTKAFYGCQQLKSVTLPEGITTIRAGVFANCSSLEEIYLPETITYMGGDYIFRSCTSLKKVNIPKQVTSLSSECFQNSGIETFIIPQNITSIGSGCFADTHLKNIKICHESYSDGSISFTEDIFNNISGITLIVPEGTKESFYTQIYPWKDFENIIEYTDQNDEHQYNAYRVELEVEANEGPAAGSRRMNNTISNNEVFTMGFTPSGVALELPTGIEKGGKKFLVEYKDNLAMMPANDVKLKVALTQINPGDIDGDGMFSVTDVVSMVNAVMNPTSISDVIKYDMDNDGDVTVSDVVILVSLVMNN